MNTIKKAALGAAVASILASPVTLAEDNWVTVYGKLNLTLDAVDQDNGDDQWELNSNASRFGVKGKGAAGDLTAFYTLEWEVDIADNSKGSTDNIKSRNQFVGLRGDFGEILAGRNDTPLKKAQQKIDIFSDGAMDMKTALNGENRISGVVQYTTPKVNGFKAKVALIPGEDTGTNDGIADGVSTGFEFKTGDLLLSAAFDSGIDGDDTDTMRIAASYKLDDLKLGFIYQDTDVAGSSADAYLASLAYTMDKTVFKVQHVNSDIWSTGVSSKVKYETMTSVGIDYKYAKKTTFVGYYGMSEEGATGDEDSIFGIGVVQKF